MQPDRRPRRVLVPVVGGDISEATLARARAALKHSDARLVLVHVVSPWQHAHCAERGQAGGCGADVPRWQQLAASVPPDRLFIDAALGEPADVILSQARRAGSDLIVLDPPDPATGPTPRAATRRHPHRRHHADRHHTTRHTAAPRRERLSVG